MQIFCQLGFEPFSSFASCYLLAVPNVGNIIRYNGLTYQVMQVIFDAHMSTIHIVVQQ